MTASDGSRDYESLQQHAGLMEILSEVSRVALEADDLDEILDRVVHFICERMPVSVTSILLVDEEGGRFVKEAIGGALDLSHPTAACGWPVTVGICGRCVRTGEPQLVIDVQSDPDYVPGNSSVQSEYIVPIRYRERILGVLNLESTSTDVFTDEALSAFDSIARQIAGAVHLATVNQQLEEANRQLERLSSIDALTGLANRRHFDATLETEVRRAQRRQSTLSLLIADADCFKALNDSAGHESGDECLRQVADVLRSGLPRSSDLVARYGGEEFGIILPATEHKGAILLADSLRRKVERRRMVHPDSLAGPWVTVSIGVASADPRRGFEPESLVRRADAALYRAKEEGRNRVIGAIDRGESTSGPEDQITGRSGRS